MGIYVNRPAAVTDPRATELRELAAIEELKIAVAIDLVLWLEDRGFVVDLRTGVAMQVSIGRVTPSGRAVSHLLTPAVESVTDGDMEQTVNGLFTGSDEECAPDGTLQAMVYEPDKDERWYEAELQDLRDGRDEEEFNRRGC